MPPKRKTRASKKAAEDAESLRSEEAETSTKEKETKVPSDSQSPADEGETVDDAVVEQNVASEAADAQDEKHSESATEPAKQTMEERLAKMKELRKMMADSSKANRKAVASELSKHRHHSKGNSNMARKLAKAEKVLDQRDAEEKGEDWERAKAWEYSIEDNERWEEKLEKIAEKRGNGDVDVNSAAAQSYRRQVNQLKPDFKAYNNQKKSLGPPSQQPTSSTTALISSSSSLPSSQQIVKRSQLPVNDSALTYGSHRPDDAALDRVSGHLNAEAALRDKNSRKRGTGDDSGEVTYINDKNKAFNQKVNRFYDKYTTEIRENFERGTAL